MAITFEAEVNGTSYNLNNSSPFRLAGLVGGGPSSAARHGRRDALWGGMVDTGYRLDSREITLSLNFYATTSAVLDTYRQTLFAIFCPTPDIPIYLRVTRDDGAIRVLETYTTGNVDIAIVPEESAAQLHRATVKLRAAKPTWRAATMSSASGTGTGILANWWLAGGAIGTALVVEHVEYPTQGQAWAFSGTVTSNWTVVFRTEPEEKVVGHAAFRHGTADNYGDPKLWRVANSWTLLDSDTALTELSSSTRTYFVWNNSTGGDRLLLVDADTTLLSFPGMADVDLVASKGAWRGDRTGAGSSFWTAQLPQAAIYNTTLDSTQRNALNAYMTASEALGTINAVNGGDVPVAPLITLQGPMTNPKITNVTTGQVISFSGLTLGSADLCYIDLTTGNKTVVNTSGSSLMSYMGTPAQLANFHLAPSPIATGGTNYIRVQGGSVGTVTTASVQHYNRYMSF